MAKCRRKSFEYANSKQLSGDTLRLLTRHTIEVAKQVYTETKIAEKPVSVVSLGYKEFLKTSLAKDAPIAVVGAGQTNGNMLRFLSKEGYTNITIYNRTFSKAQNLASSFKYTAKPLKDLGTSKYSAVISCTGADETIISEALFAKLTANTARPVAIDLAVPADIEPSLSKKENITLINMAYLQPISEQNLKYRSAEISKCTDILDARLAEFSKLIKERKLEIALKEIPKEMKAIREKAFTSVFSKDLEGLDDEAKLVVERMADYLEKKFVAIPYKHSKNLLNENTLGY